MALPPLRAIGRARVEIYGALAGSAKWDEAVWGQSLWASFGWIDLTPQSMAVRVSWGADDPTGVLTIPAAGSWVINTYDPKRLLDPSNGTSPYATSLRPGKPLRVSYIDAASQRRIVRQGLIDEIDYDLDEKRGTLRGTDMVQLMVNAVLPAAQAGLPSTLRARAAEVIRRAGLSALVPVEASVTQGVANGGFEGTGAGWSANPGTLYIEPHTPGSSIAGGAWHANLYVDTGTAVYPSLWGQFFPVVPGTTVTLSLAHMLSGAQINCCARIEWYDSAQSTIGLFSEHILSDPAGTWRAYSDSYVVPAGAAYGQVRLFFYSAAVPARQSYALWDNVSLLLPTDPPDPPVGPAIAVEAPVWTHILTASLDALYAAWLDRSGTLRFRSFGNPQDAGFQAGGADGIPIKSMKTSGSLQGVYTRIIGYNASAPTVPVEATDVTKRSIYGDITLKRDQPVPDARVWVDSVLADRSGASLQYSPGTLYPQTEAALESILELGMIDIANLVVESVEPTVDVKARVLGGTVIADTGTGWTAELSTYIPASEWEEAEQPEPPPVIPPPGTISGVVRTYACSKDARLAHSSSIDAGNGLDVNIPIGYTSPYRNRAVLGFANIPFAGVVSVDKAELLVTVGAESCGAFGSDPKVQVSRLTGSFSEGTYNVNCGFGSSNAVKYPGPSITSSGAVTASMPDNTGTQKAIDITAIVRAWQSGQPQHGIMIKSAGEDTGKYTTAIYARHHGTAGNRPSLRLTLTVQP